MHIGIKKYFHFVKKKAKMMINIDLDTPSDNFSCTLSVLGLLIFTNLSAGRTKLSLVSIKTANIYEIHKALYGVG